jgi:uncharacterized protein (TIGR02271 family)
MANTANWSANRGGVAGLFRDENRAETAIEELKAAGFSDQEIGMATAYNDDEQKDTGSFWKKIANTFGKREHTEHENEFHESLRDSGVPDEQARYFNSVLGQGGVLVTVHADPQRASEALAILQQNGADVGAGSTGAERMESSDRFESGNRTESGQQRIQLVGEILRVHKERVSRGEVRLRKEVVSEMQNVEVPVTREEIVIERVPVDGREASGVEIGSGEKEIRVPLSEERVQVEKRPVVNEEISVGKRQVQSTKRVSDEVRHEELRTDSEGDVGQETAEDQDVRNRERSRERRSA